MKRHAAAEQAGGHVEEDVAAVIVEALTNSSSIKRQAAKINEKQRKASNGCQKFPADPKTNWSGHSCSFQLAKTLPRTNPHW